MAPPVLLARYPSADAYREAFRAQITQGGLLVAGASAPGAAAMSACLVAVQLGSSPPVEVPARVAAVVPGVGVAVMFDGVPAALKALAEGGPAPAAHPASAAPGAPSSPKTGDAPTTREDDPEALDPASAVTADDAPPLPDDAPSEPMTGVAPGASELDDEAAAAGGASPERAGPLSERLKAMNVTQKMQLALSGDREERFALVRDPNKFLHIYVLKNPRIGIDEVLYAAKQPTFSPDALKMIAEHREWGSNASICTALVRNPRTPLPIALRVLDRVPKSDLRALAKGAGARDAIVHAARKKVNA